MYFFKGIHCESCRGKQKYSALKLLKTKAEANKSEDVRGKFIKSIVSWFNDGVRVWFRIVANEG